MKIYYVCNDHSLELSKYTKKPEGYTWKEGDISREHQNGWTVDSPGTINKVTTIGEFGYDKHGDLGFFIPTQDKCQPYDYPHMTSKEKITNLLLSGIQRSANYGSIPTYGALFDEVDRMLDLITFKDEEEE